MKEKERIGKLDDLQSVETIFRIHEIREYLSNRNKYDYLLSALRKYGRRNENK